MSLPVEAAALIFKGLLDIQTDWKRSNMFKAKLTSAFPLYKLSNTKVWFISH